MVEFLRKPRRLLPTNVRLFVLALSAASVLGIAAYLAPVLPVRAAPSGPSSPALTRFIYLPVVQNTSANVTCLPITSESYGTLSVNPPPTDRPAELHADLNLGLRGYAQTGGALGLVDYGGPADGAAPQFPALFADWRMPRFTTNYAVYNWSWACNCQTSLLTSPLVTLAGMQTTAGETIAVPNSGYNIGNGRQVLVLYAGPTRITLKYTRDDNVIRGYTVHVEGVCVEPRLLLLYQQWNLAGRSQLPALNGAQPFGRALSQEIRVAIQDSGAWMDPRSRKDWWQGR